MRFIDAHWSPHAFDASPLVEAFPADYGPIRTEPLLDGLEERLGWGRWPGG
jgi:hypothetical protein